MLSCTNVIECFYFTPLLYIFDQSERHHKYVYFWKFVPFSVVTPKWPKLYSFNKGRMRILIRNVLKDLILAAPNTHDSSFLGITFLIPAANPRLWWSTGWRSFILLPLPWRLHPTPTPHTNFQTLPCSTNGDIYHPLLNLKELSFGLDIHNLCLKSTNRWGC